MIPVPSSMNLPFIYHHLSFSSFRLASRPGESSHPLAALKPFFSFALLLTPGLYSTSPMILAASL